MEQTKIYAGTTSVRKNLFLDVLCYLFVPVGIVKVWKLKKKFLVKTMYSLLGIPLFLLIFLFTAIIVFGAFLKPLDMTIGDRKDRTIVNSDGNYSVTFVNTAKETNNAYELIKVEIEPGGGNGMHYHNDFEEHFTVLKGEMTLYVDGKYITLTKGQSATATRNKIHYFMNNTKSKAEMLVKTTPARGLEKSLRVTYGLTNTGQWEKDGFAKNPWHLVLLLGYSGTYLPNIPPLIQEPLVNSLAKIAQWKGEDKSLEVFFK